MQTFSLENKTLKSLEGEAHQLAFSMPDLVLEASRVAQTISHGVHGRRRAGPGETFWQFRHYLPGDAKTQIDWRRSSSSDSLFVREREWEAAHTVWIWPDLSPPMWFKSHLAKGPKIFRTLVLTFAMSDLLVRAGERVGLLGLSAPTANYNVVPKFAQILLDYVKKNKQVGEFPRSVSLSPLSSCILISDCLDETEVVLQKCTSLSMQKVHGHVVQVLDPAEETFPYSGRVEFRSHDGGQKVLLDRAEAVRQDYQNRLAVHKDMLKTQLQNMGWSYLVHHTDRSPGEALLALHQQISGYGRRR